MSIDQSSRFQDVINLLITMDKFDAQSNAYSSFIHFLSHWYGSKQEIHQSEIFIANIEWAFSKLYSLSDEKSSDRLYMIIMDTILNLDYSKPGAIDSNATSEELLSLSFNRVYKRVGNRLQLVRLLSQYKYVLKGEEGYGGRLNAYTKLMNLLRKLYSMCGFYSVEDTNPPHSQPPTITNQSEELSAITEIIKNSQTINSIFIMSAFSERFSSLRKVVYEKVKINIHNYLSNPNQVIPSSPSGNSSGAEHGPIPGFVLMAISFLSANYALKYTKEEELHQTSPENADNNNNDNNDDSFSIEKLKNAIEKLLRVESSPFIWQCALIFLTRLQTFFKPQKSLLLFSSEVVGKIQSLFTDSKISKKIAFDLVSSIPVINEEDNQDNSQFFTKQAQLFSFFSPMASVITTYEGEYIERMVKFANDRKDEPNFKALLGILPSKNSTYKAGIILGVSMKLVDNDSEYQRRCFYDYFRVVYEPRNEANNEIPSLILQAIPYCVHHGSINERNIDIVLNSVMSILCIKYLKNCPIQKDVFEFLPEALKSLQNFTTHIFTNFVTNIYQVSSIHELEIMCNYLNVKFAGQESLNQNSGVDFDQAYCITVSTLLRFILAKKTSQKTKTTFVKFIRLFSSKIGHEVSLNINENEEEIDLPIMHVSSRFISAFIPSRLSAEFLNQSFRLMNEENDISFAVVCAGSPGVDEKRLKQLIERVHSQLNSELFASFYEGRVYIAPSDTLRRLYDYTKSSTSGWFKKAPPYEFYECIITTVTSILENVSLQESDMNELMKILEISLPKNEELLFLVRKPAKRMIFSMSVNHDAKPKEAFIDKLIGTPMYADSIPGLISKVTVDDNRIKDAIHAWALHTFEDPLVREANAKFLESIFKNSTEPTTLNVIINNIVEYMGSPTTPSTTDSEKDPINAIELAQVAAEIADTGNIKYTEYSVDLILRCAEYCLSPGNELRTSTIRFLIHLFHLIIPDPSLNVSGESLLSNYEKQMSPNDICAVFMSIFTMIFKIIGEGICLQIFDKCVSSNSLKLHHVMLIRALLSVHSNTFVELRVQPLIKLCTFKASKMDPIVLAQVERSILYFAHDNTTAFTHFLCNIPMNELTTLCVNRLMMKESLRNQFINEYAKILSITSHAYYMKKKENEVIDLTNTKCGLYQLLGIISSADINMDCQGRILTCILIWLGLFYFNKLLKISSSSFSSELKTISTVFSNLVKTNGNNSGGFFFFSSGSSSSSSSSSLMNDQPVQFVINDLDEFIQCLQIAADQILNAVDAAQFDAFIDTSTKAVSTGSDAAIISIGIVFIQLLQRFSFYNSELSKSFRLKIAEVLSKCFNRTNAAELNADQKDPSASTGGVFVRGVIPTRILAYTLNTSISLPMLSQMTAIHQSHILKNLLDSCLQIRERNEYLIKSIFDLTCWLIPNVYESVINNEKQRLPEFASSFFNLSDIKYTPPSTVSQPATPKFDLVLSVGIIDVLKFMNHNGIEFIGKMGKTRLNFVNLLLLMVCGNQRADIQEKISEVLKELTSSKNEDEMISKIIQKSLDRSEVKALCGNLINICTTPDGMMVDAHCFTERYLNTLLCVYNETNGYRDEVSPFHTKVFKIFIRVISVYGSIKEEDLHEYQKSIVSLSQKALDQM
ncbi:hypothetical protein M9Y10_019243 [Tritrichomonas musculus]|uniref:Uncharacterized protein n=1 Tax=Tritrichomonas musculus TaxID=1915356 RepID=A0ABR2HIW7_9EUKA